MCNRLNWHVFFSAPSSLLFTFCARLYLFIYFFCHGFHIRINWILCRDELVYKYLIFRRFIYVCLSFFSFFFSSSVLIHFFFLLLFSSLLITPARSFSHSSTVVTESNTNNNVNGVITVTGTKIATALATASKNNNKHNAYGNGNGINSAT